MNINDLIKRAHEAAVKRGDWNCLECNGFKEIPVAEDVNGNELTNPCSCVDGITKNVNLPVWLMEHCIVPLAKACEAWKNGYHINLESYKDIIRQDENWAKSNHTYLNLEERNELFDFHVRDTFEDFLAQVYINLADLCGYLKINVFNRECEFNQYKNIPAMLFEIIKPINETTYVSWISDVFAALNELCKHLKIDLDKHIEARLAYEKRKED